VARLVRLLVRMTERERPDDGGDEDRRDDAGVIDERSYAASAAEAGGLYDEAGPTTANAEGDTMSEVEERDARPPEAPSGG
jgi:hypothetical protein